ncbi:hypothetical protein MtrunA17_Chr2g0315261 [Medicago truncatula]|uniref:Uncharacterized protein n=1 Tax=Medicago truncatula TaxID=3880 RepID=G7IR14_MEDTR|nr:hypothetical protein MTR_2g075510 [Medicago truncatula]RHN74892.1 hypothetical protein MtrunA17_Chr2g0315261 [Medicago truncatula]
MVRLLGNFTQEKLVQVLNSSMSSQVRSSFKTTRGGSRRSDLSNGSGGQINNIGTKKEKEGVSKGKREIKSPAWMKDFYRY